MLCSSSDHRRVPGNSKHINWLDSTWTMSKPPSAIKASQLPLHRLRAQGAEVKGGCDHRARRAAAGAGRPRAAGGGTRWTWSSIRLQPIPVTSVVGGAVGEHASRCCAWPAAGEVVDAQGEAPRRR